VLICFYLWLGLGWVQVWRNSNPNLKIGGHRTGHRIATIHRTVLAKTVNNSPWSPPYRCAPDSTWWCTALGTASATVPLSNAKMKSIIFSITWARVVSVLSFLLSFSTHARLIHPLLTVTKCLFWPSTLHQQWEKTIPQVVIYVYNSHISTCTWRSLVMQENYTKISKIKQLEAIGAWWATWWCHLAPPWHRPVWPHQCHLTNLWEMAKKHTSRPSPPLIPSRCMFKGRNVTPRFCLHHCTCIT
jgi:hypothetical protein